MNQSKGFSLLELLVALIIIGILGAIAIPSYRDYIKRSRYSEIVMATQPYKTGVVVCYTKTHNLDLCDGGQNGIPKDMTNPTGAVAQVKVINGVIMATPVAQNDISSEDTYVLTPEPKNGVLQWQTSGGAVNKGYAQ